VKEHFSGDTKQSLQQKGQCREIIQLPRKNGGQGGEDEIKCLHWCQWPMLYHRKQGRWKTLKGNEE
jgi:hypothetical protein